MLQDGRWVGEWKPSDDDDAKGRFVRKPSSFRDTTPLEHAASGRYHLYVAWICPWAHRTLLTRAIKGLQEQLPVHVVEPELSEQGWAFAEGADPLHGSHHLWQLYVLSDPHYTGRATVPVLWDTQRDIAVNNESSDIVRLLDALPSEAPSLCPPELADAMETLQGDMYRRLNNGVYRAGFATSQGAYEDAVADVFACLDDLEERLSDGRPWLHGEQLTESDLHLFPTLVRFEAAYHGLFKCNLRHLAAYPHLVAHGRRMLDLPGVRETVDLEHIRRGYYSIRRLNPSGIVPAGPIDPLA